MQKKKKNMSERTDCGQIGSQHSINIVHADRNCDDYTSGPDSLLKWEYIALRWLSIMAFFFHVDVAWYYSACKTLNSYAEVLSIYKDSLFKWGDVVDIR